MLIIRYLSQKYLCRNSFILILITYLRMLIGYICICITYTCGDILFIRGIIIRWWLMIYNNWGLGDLNVIILTLKFVTITIINKMLYLWTKWNLGHFDKGHNRNNLQTKEKVQCTKWRLSYTVKLLIKDTPIKDTIEISNKRQGSMYQVENFL